MDFEVRKNNLFKYATSELSQDAFICWLLAHATKEGWEEDPAIRDCAVMFLKPILEKRGLKWKPEDRIQEIKKQYQNIDIRVQFRDYYIIIEDKTFTDSHDEQINRYRKILMDEEIPEDHIICVYYKIEEQSEPEQNVDYEFTREELLKIFRPFKGSIQNVIFSDYVEYLECIDAEVHSFQSLPIEEWSDKAYAGFFTYLKKTLLKDCGASWHYIANQAGGFMGLWWWDILSKEELRGMGLPNNICENIYLQMEKNIIAVKYSIDPNQKPTKEQADRIRAVRWKLFGYFKEHLGEKFDKRRFAPGKYMTVGYVTYDEKNYAEQLMKMHDLLYAMRNLTLYP